MINNIECLFQFKEDCANDFAFVNVFQPFIHEIYESSITKLGLLLPCAEKKKILQFNKLILFLRKLRFPLFFQF